MALDMDYLALTSLEACLRFVYQVPAVSRVIVGVDSMAHLQEILQVKESPLPSLPQWGAFDTRLMNPAEWGTL
jgi:predicted aldo/keto reductase-like oxidoreductase